MYLFRLLKFWLALLLMAGGIFFALTNNEKVPVRLPPFIDLPAIPLYLVCFAFFAFGASVVSLFFGVEYLRKSWEASRLKRALSSQQSGQEDLSNPKGPQGL